MTNRDTPIFLYVTFTIPHVLYQVPDNTMYADRDWSGQNKNSAAMISRIN